LRNSKFLILPAPRQDAPPEIVEQEHITRLGAAAVTAFAMYSQPEVVRWKSECPREFSVFLDRGPELLEEDGPINSGRNNGLANSKVYLSR